MKSYHFRSRQVGWLVRALPIFMLALVFLEIYSLFMLVHIRSWHKVFENNASIISENQAFLPEISVPTGFSGDLSELVYEEGVLHVVPLDLCNVHRQDGVHFVAIDGYVFECLTAYACVDKDFIVTDGEVVYLSKRAGYWDISLGVGILGRIPDVFCKYLMLPLCALILPEMRYKYEGSKMSKGIMLFITASGVFLSICQLYMSILLMWK